MKIATIITAILFLPVFGFAQTTWYVPDDFPAGIQAAISDPSVVNGDTIIVRPGTYIENIDFIGKAITLKSEQGAAVTTIDGNKAGSVVTFKSGEDYNSKLEGFTITDGSGTYYAGFVYGGGIYCSNSSPTITDNVVTENYVGSGAGGGIYCSGGASSPRIVNNLILENFAMGGGGIFSDNCQPLILNNILNANMASLYGGGIYCYQGIETIMGNIIYSNEVFTQGTTAHGGGIFIRISWPVITNNFIYSNAASGGSSSNLGGGVCCESTDNATIVNNVFFNNYSHSGGGIGVDFNSSVSVSNNILWENIASTGKEICLISPSSCSLSINNTDLQGGPSSVYVEPGATLNWGAGMIDADPLFVDLANKDFHLTRQSPCRNTGDNFSTIYTRDFEDDPRVADGTVDMGADEYYYHLYLTGDPVPGGTVTFKVVGVPGTTPVKIYRGSLRNTPLTTQYGLLYIKKPFPHIWNVGPVPANGIATTSKTIPSSVPPGSEFYFQALHGPLNNPTTILTNLMTLTVE